MSDVQVNSIIRWKICGLLTRLVQTNYSAPTKHISFVRLFIYRANFLIEWFIINILAAHDLPPNKPLQGVLDLQVKTELKKIICSFLQLLFEHV